MQALKMLLLLACVLLATAQAAPSGPAKKCAWHALKGKEDGAGYCYVDNEYMAAVSAQPTTYIAKALSRVFGRQHVCNSITEEKACVQRTSAACGWFGAQEGSHPDVMCHSLEFTHWRWFTSNTYRGGVPFWMKGQPAAACYLKMLDAANAAKTQAACKAVPYGIWKDGRCSFAIFGNDAWGKEVAATTSVCQALSKDSQTCLGKSPASGPVNEKRYTDIKNFPEGDEAKPGPCAI